MVTGLSDASPVITQSSSTTVLVEGPGVTLSALTFFALGTSVYTTVDFLFILGFMSTEGPGVTLSVLTLFALGTSDTPVNFLFLLVGLGMS